MGGGGKSSSKSYTYNTVKVSPTTKIQNDVNIDLESLTKAIKDGTNKNLEVSKLQMALQKAGLDLEKQKQAQEWLKDEKTRNQLTILALLIGGSYLYKNMRKGNK